MSDDKKPNAPTHDIVEKGYGRKPILEGHGRKPELAPIETEQPATSNSSSTQPPPPGPDTNK